MKDNNTFIFTNAEGGFVMLKAAVYNGEPVVLSYVISREELSNGSTVVSVVGEKEHVEAFENARLKPELFTVLNTITGVDLRDLNYNIFDNIKELKEESLTLTSDFAGEYRREKVKPLKKSFIQANLSDVFTLKYDISDIKIDNSLNVDYVPINSSIYTDDESVDNIEFNKMMVSGTRLPKCALRVAEAFEKGSHNCALFYGEASTGKSFAARIIAAQLSIPVYSYNFAAGSDESFVQGKYAPKEDEAGFTFLQNSFIKAYSEGGLFIAEELNYAFANVTGPLNSALDFLKKITLANEKELQMHPNFRMITAINPGYEGTQPLNRALLSRQELVVRFENIKPAEVASRLQDRLGYNNTEFAEELGKFIEKLNKTLYTEGVDGYVSLREAEAMLKLVDTTGTSISEAIQDTMISKALMDAEDYTIQAFKKTIANDIKELQTLYDNSVSDEDVEYESLVVSDIDDEQLDSVFSALRGADTNESK